MTDERINLGKRENIQYHLRNEYFVMVNQCVILYKQNYGKRYPEFIYILDKKINHTTKKENKTMQSLKLYE